MGPELVLVRHGRTALNAEGRFVGASDPPLDEVGRAHARSVAARWRGAAVVYTSPLLRARETAAALTPSAVVVPDLRELHQGALEGLTPADAMARFPDLFRAWRDDPTQVVLPGGESLGACRDRALTALSTIAGAHAEGERVVIVSHQLAIAAVCATIVGGDLRQWRSFGLDHGGACALAPGPSGWRMLHHDRADPMERG